MLHCLFMDLLVSFCFPQVLQGISIDSKSAYITIFIFNDFTPGLYFLSYFSSFGGSILAHLLFLHKSTSVRKERKHP